MLSRALVQTRYDPATVSLASLRVCHVQEPLKIVKAKVKKGKGGKVKPEDIMLFTRQLATMLQAGLPLSEALAMQASGAGKIALSELLYAVKTDVDRGGGLSNALAKHPLIFDRTYVGLVAKNLISVG